MIKFKIYGVFFALIYSFFFYTLAHVGDHFPREEAAAESQIRPLDIRNEEKIVIPLKTPELSQLINSNTYYPPVSPGFGLKVEEIRDRTGFFIDRKLTLLVRTLATERNRVLRN